MQVQGIHYVGKKIKPLFNFIYILICTYRKHHRIQYHYMHQTMPFYF